MLFDNVVENPGVIRMVAALSIILLGLVLGRFLGNLIRTILKELEANRLLRKLRVGFNLEESSYYIFSVLTYILAINLALKQLGITTLVLYVVSGIIVVLLLMVAALSIKGTLPNLMAGWNILTKKPFSRGNKIILQEIEGKPFHLEGRILKIQLTETIVESKNRLIFIPNTILMKNKVSKKHA